jgi:hypothetical protein
MGWVVGKGTRRRECLRRVGLCMRRGRRRRWRGPARPGSSPGGVTNEGGKPAQLKPSIIILFSSPLSSFLPLHSQTITNTTLILIISFISHHHAYYTNAMQLIVHSLHFKPYHNPSIITTKTIPKLMRFPNFSKTVNFH